MKPTPPPFLACLVALASILLVASPDTCAAECTISAYQGKRLYEWDGRYLAHYQGKRLYASTNGTDATSPTTRAGASTRSTSAA